LIHIRQIFFTQAPYGDCRHPAAVRSQAVSRRSSFRPLTARRQKVENDHDERTGTPYRGRLNARIYPSVPGLCFGLCSMAGLADRAHACAIDHSPGAVTDGNYPLSAASACASLLGLTGFTK